MDCPNCKVSLSMTDRQGVEIDFCPKCRGVWLDRGELDKIIERSTGTDYDESPREQQGSYDHERGQRPYSDHDYHGKHKKRRSFLSDLFDFD